MTVRMVAYSGRTLKGFLISRIWHSLIKMVEMSYSNHDTDFEAIFFLKE
jgi:hypothetical protein